MQVTITARCYYCTHSFTLGRDPFGALEGEDASGRLCCETCFCIDCGGGHATDAEQGQCTYLFDPTDDDYRTYGNPDFPWESQFETVY